MLCEDAGGLVPLIKWMGGVWLRAKQKTLCRLQVRTVCPAGALPVWSVVTPQLSGFPLARSQLVHSCPCPRCLGVGGDGSRGSKHTAVSCLNPRITTPPPRSLSVGFSVPLGCACKGPNVTPEAHPEPSTVGPAWAWISGIKVTQVVGEKCTQKMPF